MDTPEAEVKYMRAGADYLKAIQALGLDPDALFWARDEVVNRYVLVLITDMFDFKGPYEISKLLFQAYNNAGTPKGIDPFVIRLHSPNQSVVRDLVSRAAGGFVQKVNKVTGKPEGEKVRFTGGTVAGLELKTDWLYKAALPKKRNPVVLSRRWSRFHRNVEKLAA